MTQASATPVVTITVTVSTNTDMHARHSIKTRLDDHPRSLINRRLGLVEADAAAAAALFFGYFYVILFFLFLNAIVTAC